MVFGVTGLFLRFLDRPIGWVRYLTDASYWLYLVHFPLAAWMPIALLRVDLPAVIKFGLAVIVIMVVSLVSYDRLVRPTVVGKILNGRRLPRWAPARRIAGEVRIASAPAH
jgi:glucan biosynthesis protein C